MSTGQGFGYSLFGNSIKSNDVTAINNYANALKNGASVGEAWRTTMTGTSVAAKQYVLNARKAGKSTAELTQGLNNMTLGAKASTVAMKALGVAKNITLNIGVMLLITGVAKGIDYLIHRTEKMQEALQNSVDGFNTVTDELKTLEEELKTTTERLEELQKLADNGTISVAEEAELENLKKTNKELARKIALKQQEQAQEARDVLKDSRKNANSTVSSKYNRKTTASGNNEYGVSVTPDEELELAIKAYETNSKTLENNRGTNLEGWYEDQTESAKNRIEKMYDLISPTIDAYEDLINAGIKLEGEDKTRYEQLKKTQDAYLAYIYTLNGTKEAFEGLNAEQQRNVLLNRLIKQGLSEDVAKAIIGSISDEDLSKYWDKNFSFVPPEMKDGETAEEYGKRYAEAWAKGLEEGAKDTDVSLEALNKALDNIQSAYDKVKSAIEEYNEAGYLSVDTYQELLSLEPEYLRYLMDEEGNLRLGTDAMNEYTSALIDNMAQKQMEKIIDYVASLDKQKRETYLAKQATDDASMSLVEFAAATMAANFASGDLSEQGLQSLTNMLNSVANWAESAKAGIGKGGLSKDSGKNAKDTAKEIAKEKEEYAEKVAEINEDLAEKEAQFAEDMAEAWKEEHLEQLKDGLEKQKDIIDQYKKNLEVTDWGLDIIQEDDFSNKSDLLSKKLSQLTSYGVAMRDEFERVASIMPQTGEEAQELASRIEELGSDMRDNISAIRQTKVEMMRLRVDAISQIMDTQLGDLERELDNITRRIEILNGDDRDDFKYTSHVLSMQALLPSYSDFESQRKEKEREDEELIELEQDTQDTINKIVSDALAQQAKDNAAAREKERQELIKDMEKARQDAAEKLEDARKDHEEKMEELQEQTATAMGNIQDIINSTDFELNPVNFDDFLSSVKSATDEAKSLIDEFNEYKSNALSSTHDISDGDRLGAAELDLARKTGFFNGGSSGSVVDVAKQAIGVPYVWGGTSMNGFDCSGLVQWAYAQKGIKIPRTTYEQVNSGTQVSLDNLLPGDLLFNTDNSHVVMYAGNGQIIEAPRTGLDVRTRSYNRNEWARATRVTSNATGTPFHPGGLAMVGDENWLKGRNTPSPEMAIYPDGTCEIIGQDGVEIRDLPKGTQVIPTKPTKKILNGIPNYADGTSWHEVLLRSMKSSREDAISTAQERLGKSQLNGTEFDQTAFLESRQWTFVLEDGSSYYISGLNMLDNVINLIEGLTQINRDGFINTEKGFSNFEDMYNLMALKPQDTGYSEILQKINDVKSRGGENIAIGDAALDEYLMSALIGNSPLKEEFENFFGAQQYLTIDVDDSITTAILNYYKSITKDGIEIQRNFEEAAITYNSVLESEILNFGKTTEEIIADALNPDTNLGRAFADYMSASVERENFLATLEEKWANKEWIWKQDHEDNPVARRKAEVEAMIGRGNGLAAFIVGSDSNLGDHFPDDNKSIAENILKYYNNEEYQKAVETGDSSYLDAAKEFYNNFDSLTTEQKNEAIEYAIGGYLDEQYRLAGYNGREFPDIGGWQRVAISAENGHEVPWDEWDVKILHPAAIGGTTFRPIEGYEGRYGAGDNTFITKDGQIVRRGAFFTEFFNKNDPSSYQIVSNAEATELIPESIRELVLSAVPSYDEAIQMYFDDKNNAVQRNSVMSSVGNNKNKNPELDNIDKELQLFRDKYSRISANSLLRQEEINNKQLSYDDRAIELYKLSSDIYEQALEMSVEYHDNLASKLTDYLKLTEEQPDLYDQEVVEAYMDALDEVASKIYDLESAKIDMKESVFEGFQNDIDKLEEFIEVRNHFDDWDMYDTSEIEMLNVQLDKLRHAYDIGALSVSNFNSLVADTERRIHDLLKEDAVKKLNHNLTILSSIESLTQTHYDTLNSIADVQHEIDKEIRASLTMYEYLDEKTRDLLFNQKDYNTLTLKLADIQSQANALQEEFSDKIRNANEHEIAELTSQYQMQYEILMKSYEIAEADLEVAKKKQKLNNVLAEKNVRMFVGGGWRYVANVQDVINAQNELADARYNVGRATTNLEQTESLNEIKQAHNTTSTALNYLEEGVYSFNQNIDDINTRLSGINTKAIPALNSIIGNVGAIMYGLISGLQEQKIETPVSYSDDWDYSWQIAELVEAGIFPWDSINKTIETKREDKRIGEGMGEVKPLEEVIADKTGLTANNSEVSQDNLVSFSDVVSESFASKYPNSIFSKVFLAQQNKPLISENGTIDASILENLLDPMLTYKSIAKNPIDLFVNSALKMQPINNASTTQYVEQNTINGIVVEDTKGKELIRETAQYAKNNNLV